LGYNKFTCELESVHKLQFNCHIESEGLLKITGSHIIHIHCKSHNILLTVQDSDVFTTDRWYDVIHGLSNRHFRWPWV